MTPTLTDALLRSEALAAALEELTLAYHTRHTAGEMPPVDELAQITGKIRPLSRDAIGLRDLLSQLAEATPKKTATSEGATAATAELTPTTTRPKVPRKKKAKTADAPA